MPEARISGLEIARAQGVKDVAIVACGDHLYDVTHEWPADAQVRFLRREDPEVLALLRHDAAHIMAEAVKALYPEVQVTIGPATKDGFYYDFYRETPFTPEDLPRIEEKMHAIIQRDAPFERQEWSREQAIQHFEAQGEAFKVELIRDLPKDDVISVYSQGDFLDLCRGPHLPSTGFVGQGFKLLRLAGAYWRGDSNRPMLQRIYGTCFPTTKALRTYLAQVEEAKKRDHRKLGTEMSLYHFQEEATGSVFWHPKGWTIYRQLQDYIRMRLQRSGYQEINTPQMLSRKFWEKSGHWDKFRGCMIACHLPEDHAHKEPQALKPMSCPGHIEVFRQGIKSYRDLPLRFSEFGSCLRYEPSGALMGLMRVRAFTQDDAHIFCTEEQVLNETRAFCNLLRSVYKDFGFEKLEVLFSDRPKVRAGTDEIWTRAEEALKAGAEAAGLSFSLNPGEGAFYGPKLEFVLHDSLGRPWQCGTLQADFVLPERLGATYADADGMKKHPVLLHRAILGSFERFIGVLVEHYGGKFPLWLAPLQVAVLPITNAWDGYAQEVGEALQKKGLSMTVDTRSVKVHAKIREFSVQKVPYLFVVGEREAAERKVSVRTLGGKSQETVCLDEGVERLASLAKIPQTA